MKTPLPTPRRTAGVRRRATGGMLLAAAVAAAVCAADEPTPKKKESAAVRASPGAVLREDFDARAFHVALLGAWQSAWPHPSGRLVTALVFRQDGHASVRIVEGGATNVVEGAFSVSFLRPPAPHMVTQARVTIRSEDGHALSLSPVSFGLHNALRGGPFLRVDGPPYGVLARAPATPAAAPPAGGQQEETPTRKAE